MLRVVLADDEKKVLLLMCKLIDWESLGFEIVGMASDGMHALEMIRDKQPHLLVTDIRMPGFDGIDLIRQAKQMQPGLHFIVVSGYAQFEYISDEMKDFFAMADLIISRAGANSICEISALKKPNILIPLSARVSRGDQILNARSYAKQGFSEVLDEDVATKDDLIAMVHKVFDNKSHYIESMEKSAGTGGVDKIIGLINEITDK